MIAKSKEIKKTVKKTAVKKTAATSLSLDLYDQDGKSEKKLTLPKEIFSVEADPKLLVQYTRVFLTNQRQGNASTKTRGEVIGSTRKIYRQKGTGKARHGDIKAPIFVGGGIVGGPKPKNFALKLNQSQKRKALFYALSKRQKQADIIGLSENVLKIEPKTKIFKKLLNTIGVKSNTILIVLPKLEKNNLMLAARNIPEVVFSDAKVLNAYEVVRVGKILMLENTVEVMMNHYFGKK